VGDARLALEAFRGTVALDGAAFERVRARMEQPSPRIALGQAVRGVATSAIDVSDGLLGDLRHILARSGVGATVEADAVPVSADLAAQTLAWQRECALAGGDDYELLFTAPAAQEQAVHDAARLAGCAAACIGRIEIAGAGLRVVDRRGAALDAVFAGFDHFG
jgi:thiamine-monophosphate kinase